LLNTAALCPGRPDKLQSAGRPARSSALTIDRRLGSVDRPAQSSPLFIAKKDATMKNVITVAVAVSFLALAPATAQTIDMRNVKCKDVAALPKDALEMIAVWLDGFFADDDDADSMKVDFTATRADGEKIKAFCQKNPTVGVLQAAEALDK
jgi:hypothetical protein